MSEKKPSKNLINNLLDGRQLVLVSNRGPVTFARENGQIVAKRGAGGLITAVDAALSSTRAIWVANALSAEDRVIASQPQPLDWPVDHPRYQVSLVDVPPENFDLYYNEVSNKILWFLQHYLFDTVNDPVFGPDEQKAWESGYRYVNQQVAAKVSAVVKDEPEPVIMIQDYHLYLVGGLLRQRLPEARLLHFTHIPWPAADYFRLIPGAWRREILESLLSCDVVGFHSRRYVRNFLQCCEDFLGTAVDYRRRQVTFNRRQVTIKAYPISIDADDLLDISRRPAVRDWQKKIEAQRKDCRLIIRVDRAELSKNLVRGFKAFRRLLERYPEHIGRVKFIAYAYPTRQDVPQYSEYRREIQAQVGEINDEFGRAGWQPIELEIADDFNRSVAAMTAFDVMLTNPVFDGMNLVAKEAAVLNERDGVIVLSENAGAYEELRDGVIGVNPFDIEETATRLHEALTMTPLERQVRAERVREIVVRNNSMKWLKHQTVDLLKKRAPHND